MIRQTAQQRFFDPVAGPRHRTLRGRATFLVGFGSAIAIAALTELSIATVAADDSSPQSSEVVTVPLVTLDGPHAFQPPDDLESWGRRAEQLRRRVQIACGLWPMPKRIELAPVISDPKPHDGFQIRTVDFESLPGHHVTGLLFEPSPENDRQVRDGRRPAVLSPHGHGGRNGKLSERELAKQLKSGAERFSSGGHRPKIARCATLARMGCSVFIFDMLGYDDSNQIDREFVHRQGDDPAAVSDENGWTFFSTEAELRLQTPLMLQTFNAVRSLEFLRGLPDVDSKRIGVTGGSGGGTQTILLGVLDPGFRCSFPNGMVSIGMQGGCFCENASLLRIGTNNAELAAVYAPRPQAMTAADDWTRDMMHNGFPQIEHVYGLYGAAENARCTSLLQFPHNYNYVTRSWMYRWMNRHLNLDAAADFEETDLPRFSDDSLAVHRKPPQDRLHGIEHMQAVCRWFDENDGIEDADEDAFAEILRAAWRLLTEAEIETRVVRQNPLVTAHERCRQIDFTIDCEPAFMTLPVRVFVPTGPADRPSKLPPLLWLTDAGRMTHPNGSDRSEGDDVHHESRAAKTFAEATSFTQAIELGREVWTVDLLHQGSRRIAGVPPGEQPIMDDDHGFAGYTFGYNPSLSARRVTQVRELIRIMIGDRALLPNDVRPTAATVVDVIADGDVEAVAMMAAAKVAMEDQAAAKVPPSDAIRSIWIAGRFHFEDLDSYRQAAFVPGALKYRGMKGLKHLVGAERVHSPEIVAATSDEFPKTGQERFIEPAADSLRAFISGR